MAPSLPAGTEAAPFFAEVADAPEGAAAFWLTASDGVRIRATVWQGGSRGTALVFPGRTEFAEKYGRVAGRLVARGFSVVVIDWRGQGLADRPPANPMLGHVQDFRDYQRDVAAVTALEHALDLPGPRVMLAHSMGGCIGLRTLLETGDYRAAVFSAPMWHLQMKAVTRELTAKMTRIAGMVGLGARLLPGARGAPTPLVVQFADNPLTSDPDVFDWCVAQLVAHPELGLGGPSMQWTRAAFEEMARLYVAPLPRLPVLALLGRGETVVSAGVIRSQVAKMPQGTLLELPGARHEVLMETPVIQSMIWDRIDSFLEAALNSGPDRRVVAAVSGR